MIASIKKGNGFLKVLKYTLGEEKDKSVVAGNLLGTTPEELNKEFLDDIQNSKIKDKLWFSSLSLSSDETDQEGNKRELTDNEWGQIAESYVKHMGFEHSNYIAVRHNDTAHAHIHVIASRIDFYGKTVSDSLDYKKAMLFCREVEKEKGLREVNAPPNSLDKNVSQNEFQMMKRTGILSIKEEFKIVINDAKARSETMTEFITHLQDKTSLHPVFNVQKTGRVAGISYLDTRTDVMMKGSDLGKRYSFTGLQKQTKRIKGLSYDNERDDRAIGNASRRANSRDNRSNDGGINRGVGSYSRRNQNIETVQRANKQRGNYSTRETDNFTGRNMQKYREYDQTSNTSRHSSDESLQCRRKISRDNRRNESSSTPTQRQVSVPNTMGQNPEQGNRLPSNDSCNHNSNVPSSKILSFTRLTGLLERSRDTIHQIDRVKSDLVQEYKIAKQKEFEKVVEKQKELSKSPNSFMKSSGHGMEF